MLYEPGDKADKFYVVLHGALSFYHYHLGEFAYLRDHPFGEEMGFVAMIALHDRVGKAVAAQDCHVLEISSTLFHELAHPALLQYGEPPVLYGSLQPPGCEGAAEQHFLCGLRDIDESADTRKPCTVL